MHSLLRIAAPLFGLLLVIFSTGCGEDSGPGGVTLGPVLQLNSGSGLISGDADLDLATSSFIVSITGNDGDAALQSLRISENNQTIPSARLNFRTGQVSNNPILIAGDDVNGFTYEVEILGNPGAPGEAVYEFTLRDVNGESATQTVRINFTQTAPLVELLIEDGVVSGDATVNSFNGIFDVRVSLSAPADSIASLSVLEDGNLMDRSQIQLGNLAFGEVGNPIFLLPSEALGADFRITINPDGTTNDTRTYTFRATDVNGVSGERSISVTFETPPGTPLSMDTSGVFFNASGPNLGGLDLDNATAVRFNSTEAEIQDEGIDTRVAVGEENWRRQISAANDDVEVRAVTLVTMGDGLQFSTVMTKEEIVMAFDEGSQLSGDDDFPDTDGDQSRNELVSAPINGTDANSRGEVFAVKRGDRYYLVQFTTVNFAPDNRDSYTVAIKY